MRNNILIMTHSKIEAGISKLSKISVLACVIHELKKYTDRVLKLKYK